MKGCRPLTEAEAARVIWLLTLRQMPGCTARTFVFRSRKEGNRPISEVQAWRLPHPGPHIRLTMLPRRVPVLWILCRQG
jgi:hypothetical protein